MKQSSHTSVVTQQLRPGDVIIDKISKELLMIIAISVYEKNGSIDVCYNVFGTTEIWLKHWPVDHMWNIVSR